MLTMRINSLKLSLADLILSLSKDEATFSGFFSILLAQEQELNAGSRNILCHGLPPSFLYSFFVDCSLLLYRIS